MDNKAPNDDTDDANDDTNYGDSDDVDEDDSNATDYDSIDVHGELNDLAYDVSNCDFANGCCVLIILLRTIPSQFASHLDLNCLNLFTIPSPKSRLAFAVHNSHGK